MRPGSLFFRLMGAFALVILVGSVVVYSIASLSTTREFESFMFRGQMLGVQQLADQLAAFYQARGSWEGVQTLVAPGNAGGGGMMGFGMMQGNGMMGPTDIVVADSDGRIVAASDRSRIGQALSPGEASRATPIIANGQTVGRLLATSGMMGTTSDPASLEFLNQISHSLLVAGLVAGLIALALGFVLFKQITSPLGQLAGAAAAVAGGDLSARAPETGADEVAQVGRAFNAMAQNLARSESARRRMLADIAHELRNPLGVLSSHLEAMIDGVFPTDKAQIVSLTEETRFLTHLVDDLHELAVAETGQLRLTKAPADLAALVGNSVEAFEALASEKGVTLRAEVSPGLGLIQFDRQRIEQVFHNLLSNALRHTPRGGRITVRATREPERVRCVVEDTGEGIPPQDLPHIFERFWRGDKSADRAEGAGLGLAIAKQWVEAHGGEIGAESQEGRGTKIWFTLPAAKS